MTDSTDSRSPGATVDVSDLRMRFGNDEALSGLTFSIAPDTICGVLGRNGAGKTTMLRLLAAYERPTSGSIRIDGVDPYENERLMAEICLVRDSGNVTDDSRISEELELCELLRPRWDGEYAARLLDRFELDPGKKVGKLSRGQKSAVAIVIGLATRAPLTMFDEPHLGLDAPSRAVFYDELLTDYLEHPRTILISSHLIDEVAPLLEQVVVIDRGAVLVDAGAEELRARGTEVTGPADLVEAFTMKLDVLATRRLGSTAASTVFTELDADQRRQAASLGLDLGPLPLQDLFIALTTKESAS